MSVGGSFVQSLNDAADALVESGIFLGAAAGNSNTDASEFSPASAESSCTVGAASPWDGRWLHSNYGSVVDIYAVGQNVLSTVPGGGAVSFALLSSEMLCWIRS